MGLHLQNAAGAGLDHAQLLVLARGGEQAAVGVEGHAEDHVRVAVNHLHGLTHVQVPDEDLGGQACRSGVSPAAAVIGHLSPVHAQWSWERCPVQGGGVLGCRVVSLRSVSKADVSLSHKPTTVLGLSFHNEQEGQMFLAGLQGLAHLF